MTEIRKDNANGPMEQAVADCFDTLLAAIRKSEDSVRDRAAEAVRNRDDARARDYLAAVQRTVEAGGEVEALSNKWKSRLPAVPAIPAPPTLPSHPKGPRSKLRVHLNGDILEYSTAKETFARTIEKIGIEPVARLGKTLSGFPLVSKFAAPYQEQFVLGEYRICTHANNRTKKRRLNQIATELGVSLKVEITA
jgi:hypothetical protein